VSDDLELWGVTLQRDAQEICRMVVLQNNGNSRCRLVIMHPTGDPWSIPINTTENAGVLAQTLELMNNLATEQGYANAANDASAKVEAMLTRLGDMLTQAALVLSGAEVVAKELPAIRAEARKKSGKKKRGD
jgi:hypothetical protein